ncbi:hypothetical protein ACA910_022747 [Epithemia clementina (nom. ined.)]
MVNRQRQNYRKMQNGKHSSMTWERKYLLKMIDPDWDPSQTFWMKQYGELVDYAKSNMKIACFPNNPELGRWVSQQVEICIQIEKYKGKPSFLPQERVDLLERIGFGRKDPGQSVWRKSDTKSLWNS